LNESYKYNSYLYFVLSTNLEFKRFLNTKSEKYILKCRIINRKIQKVIDKRI